ncbi:MAG: cysteine--tRNA ligase [Polyangiales bacterium]
MPIRLHNTLTGKKEPFSPIHPEDAKVYVCGPTVYDYSHLGHARCYVIYDVLVRHLRENGQKVTFVRNITDVDDKILNRAAEAGEDPTVLAAKFAAAYAEDMATLGNLEPDIEPKVSEHIDEILALVQTLIDNGHAYESDGDVYFAVETFEPYGKLSHRDLTKMISGASERLDAAQTARKRHPADFALWKSSADDAWGWNSPWGKGRPGWHIECSAMSMKHLGPTLDLHGGGIDLVFPHHENEIAQSEAATGKTFSTCWMHNGFVEVNKEKMSKSLGNFFTARQLFDRVTPEAIRYFMMTVHYRAPLNLNWTLDDEGNVIAFPQFEEAERRVEYLYNTRQRLNAIPESRIVEASDATSVSIAEASSRITEALDDDLNMPIALSHIAEFLKAVNELCDTAEAKKGKASRAAVNAANAAFDTIAGRLGLAANAPDAALDAIRDRRARRRNLDIANVESKIAERRQARIDKDFARSDAIRDELASMGVEIFDKTDGTTWRVR